VRCQFSPIELQSAGVLVPPDIASPGDDASVGPVDRVTFDGTGETTCPEQLLRDTDQMSMAHSLEVRVPFLDDSVGPCGLAMPASVRTRGEKQLLADAARISPTRKRPFSLPFGLMDAWPADG
jgi:hypothetical protein